MADWEIDARMAHAVLLQSSMNEKAEALKAAAATSVAANCRASCRARSRAEFAAKIAVVLEESDEAGELTAIFAQSSITARASL
jgi:four helix bundle protein